MDQQPDEAANEAAEPTASPRDTTPLSPPEMAARKARETKAAARRMSYLFAQYADRQDLAWWPEQPKPDPCGRSELYFYRPGQLLVKTSELPVVRRVLAYLGVEFCQPGRDGGEPPSVVRLLVVSRDPIPVLVRRLRCYGLEADVVGPNHVFWPTNSYSGAPWLSGGGDSLPKEETTGPVPLAGSRGAGVTVLECDSGLVPGWSARWTWLGRTDGIEPSDVEGQGGDPDGPDLDIYDSHATFVAGVLACTAPQAQIKIRNVLDESGAVADFDLCDAIRKALQKHPAELVNLSLGGTTIDDTPPLALANLVTDHPGVVFVAAAGNNGAGGADFWPAALPNVVGVGALTSALPRVPTSFSNVISADVWAVGEHVVNAFGLGTLVTASGSQPHTTGYASWSGTSFAAPLVTGVLCDYVAGNGTASGTGAIAWLQQNYPTVQGRVIVEA